MGKLVPDFWCKLQERLLLLPPNFETFGRVFKDYVGIHFAKRKGNA